MDTPTLGKAMDDYMKAVQELKEAREEVRIAQRREINAVNAVNNSQKEIDAHLAKVRKDSPAGTDWSKPAPGAIAEK